MPAITYQCPTCKSLVSTAAAVVDADRAGLVCTSCGATTWLPSASSSGATVIDVDVRPAPPPPNALAARGFSSSVPAVVGGRAVATSGAPWTVEERARVDERVAKLADPAHAELHGAFKKMLDVWGNDAEHKALLKRAQLSGDLAYAGQMYRAVLDAMPLDPFAKKAQGEILTLAMATMSSSKDLGTPERGQARNLAFLLVGAVFLAVVLLVGVKLLKTTAGEATIDDGTGVPPAP